MKAAFLPDRGVVKVSGEDARDFLNGLVTTDVTLLQPGLGRFGALLTPQGKITIDFLITEAPAGHGGGFLIDAPRPLAQSLADKLGFYKLRAKVAVENISDSMGVLAVWDGEPAMKPDLAFADPRHEALGWRILVPEELRQKVADLIGAELVDEAAYDVHRIASACRAAGSTSCTATRFRTRPTWTACRASISTRAVTSGKRWCPGCSIAAPRAPAPPGSRWRFLARSRYSRRRRRQPVGTMGSTAGGHGIALLRTDRVADALDAGLTLSAGGLAIRLTDPNDVRTPPKQTVA